SVGSFGSARTTGGASGAGQYRRRDLRPDSRTAESSERRRRIGCVDHQYGRKTARDGDFPAIAEGGGVERTRRGAPSDAGDFAGGIAATCSQSYEGPTGREAAPGRPGHAESERFQRVTTRVSRS